MLTQDIDTTLECWRLMGGVLDWAAFPIICEVLGVFDPELLILQLVELREYFAQQTT